MATKQVNINLEVSETIDRFVTTFSQINKISKDEAYIKLLNAGINKGAKDIHSALIEGIKLERETIKFIAEINRLSQIVDKPIKPANEVEAILAKNVELGRDEKLIEKIKKEVLKRDN